MPYVTVGTENSAPIELYYEDHGSGQPVVLIHGYPLDGSSWEKQTAVLLDAGKRVITYDRRGFGKSSRPTSGHDYDTYAADLSSLLSALDIHDVVLVGFSMGTGEVVRYISTLRVPPRGQGSVHRRTPALHAEDRREPLRASHKRPVDGMLDTIKADRYAFFTGFLQNFYNTRREPRHSDQRGGVAKQLAAGCEHVAVHVDLGTCRPGSPIGARTSTRSTYRALIMHGTARPESCRLT